MLNDPDIDIEKKYQREEGLGISIEGTRSPTPYELNEAFKRGQEWETRYRSAKPEDREP